MQEETDWVLVKQIIDFFGSILEIYNSMVFIDVNDFLAVFPEE